MKVELLEQITLQGGQVEAGETVELPKKSAQALINEGKAEAVEEKEPTPPETGGEGNEDNTPPKQTEPGQENAGDDSEGVNTQNEEEAVERLKKALDDQYKRDELAEAAKKAGVEFAYDAKKDEIVEAVITAGKAEALTK